MRVTIIGLGLIGGSIAIDLRKKRVATQLIGVDQNDDHASEALRLGIVDEIRSIEEAMENTDLVILSIPVSAMVGVIGDLLTKASPGITIIDTGSTKAAMCKSVRSHVNRSQFVAAHPIAGTENSGPSAAFSGLFNNKTMIVCEKELSSDSALDVANKVFAAMGVKTIFMEPVEHDKHVAYVSHLSHVSSFLLGQTVMDIEKDEKNIFDLAGSGFASTVRLAKSSPDMWAPIFEQNVEYLSQALLEYIMHLQRFHYHLMKKDSKEIHRIMTEANEIRRVLSGIELKDEKLNKVESLIEE
ncbi:MAG: prephenate dehydrogenase [Cyclobacteriaceae bacterium]